MDDAETLNQLLKSGAGTLVVIAFFCGAFVRLLRTPPALAVAARFNLEAQFKLALPWIALALGAGGAGLEAVIEGMPVGSALVQAFWGLVAGAVAVAGHETVAKTAKAVKDGAK